MVDSFNNQGIPLALSSDGKYLIFWNYQSFIFIILEDEETDTNWKNILFYGGLIFGGVILLIIIIIIVVFFLKKKKTNINSQTSIKSTESYTSVVSYE